MNKKTTILCIGEQMKYIRKTIVFECPNCHESFKDTVDCYPSGTIYEKVYCPYCDYLFNPDEEREGVDY